MEIRVNIEEIEYLAYRLRRIVMDTDDICLRLRILQSEMEEDSEIQLLPDGLDVLEKVSEALVEITATHETTVQLYTLVEQAPELFREQEKLYLRRMSELSKQLEMLDSRMNAAMHTEQMVLEGDSSAKHEAEVLEHVIFGAPMNLEILDVSPTKKRVDELFPVRKIVDME